MSFRKPLLALVMVSAAGFGGTAFATTPSTCAADQDCGRGYTCQVYAVVPTPAPGPASDCPPDATCTKDGSGGVSGAPSKSTDGAAGASGTAGAGGSAAVITNTISMCQPGPCTTDSDCATDMICHTESISECSGGTAKPPCRAGTKCDTTVTVTPATCTTKTSSVCAFRWQLPCNADADCGTGFVCQPSVSGSCSGGSPVSGGGVGGNSGGASADAGVAPSSGATTPAETCTTTTSFPGYCQAAVPSCETDTDCPANWVCQPNATVGSSGAGGETGTVSGSSGSGTTGSGDSPGLARDVATVPATKMCSAPFSAPQATKGTGSDGNVGATPTSGSASGTGGTSATDGTPPGTATGTGGTGTNGTTSVNPGSANGTGGAGGDRDSNGPGAVNDNAGCSVSPRGAHPNLEAALLVLVGLGLVFVRRHRGRRSR